ncbi:DoxX family protein [Flavihumibacter rivuli]|uniref:DoxX family protein n=1 Tax=Flavihumibacter rivuli TaxID=2838156 RepID=UPI001BDE91BA|nr:DoxX family protein [Flavihumibacter rivuli]ULQ56025.1 DoxX family protein [Flavihumibacter rivuli]
MAINDFFSPGKRIWLEPGIAVLRILTGMFMVYHGWEIFQAKQMQDYAKWLTDLHFPAPETMAYLGKAAELVAGIGITLGLFTRIAIFPMILTMLVICFGMGKGNIFYGEQHPFLFVMLGLLFFFYGPGKYSLDQKLFANR